MKTKIKVLSLFLVLMLLLSTFAACFGTIGSKGETELTDLPVTQDKYRTYYEIFPYAFADSDGDGVGDINGITAKLDYVADLNYDGIWLTPVHQSPTYHKYDVTDYKSIDRQFGTLADFDKMVETAHSKGINILMDLVLNHSAIDNEWFEQCAWARSRERTDNQYYDYYNFEKVSSSSQLKSGWAMYSSTLAYECQFWTGMPDLNLQNVLDEPNGYLANDIKEILRFWLIDYDVDGFRLDAVTTYFTGDQTKNKEFLTWLNTEAKKIKPDCYIVGEGAWGNTAENLRYQESGIDSFFAFQNGHNANGNFSYAVRLNKAAYLSMIDTETVKTIGGGIAANFISNHDTGRANGISMASVNPNNLKNIFGLMAMTNGATFTYYGDEIGMTVLSIAGSNDSYKDEDKRQPMPWGDSYQCKPVAASTAGADSDKYPFGNVADQLADANSSLNFVARANAIRRAFPVIARSVAVQVYLNADRTLCVVSKGEGEGKIYIVWNASATASQVYDAAELGGIELLATLSSNINEIAQLSGSSLTVPAQSFAIFKVK
jgi:glycosidase